MIILSRFGRRFWRRTGCLLGAAVCAWAQVQILPVDQVRADQEGVARTVFRGQAAEEFPLRILGVMKNSGPGQTLILARLLTERMEQTGVMQGMSGSPVYVEGKLVGAIAFAFPFAKEPVAGIRPVGEMLEIPRRTRVQAARPGKLHLGAQNILEGNDSEFAPVAEGVLTPVSLAGFSERTVAQFAEVWRRLGFRAQQGAAGSNPQAGAGNVAAGEMISVQLLRGDMVAGADGTVTHREGNRIYAFGHRFLGAGEVDFPFTKAEVLTPVPNYNLPFKISQSLGEAGAIRLDADAGVVGELGARARMIPVRVRALGEGLNETYSVEMVRHNVLSPLLVQMSVFSVLDHLLKAVGSGTVQYVARARYGAALPELLAQGRYAGDANLPLAASLSTAIPLAYVGQQMGDALLPEAVEVDVQFSSGRDQWAVEGLRLSRKSAKPGETVEIEIALAAGAKRHSVRERFVVPAWVQGGQTLTVSLQDALTANLVDFRAFYQPGGPVFADAGELIRTLNRLHPAGNLYLRVMRSGAAYQSGVNEVANVPHSLAALMMRQPGQYPPGLQAKVLDREIVLPSGVGSGSRMATLEIEK